jgi:dipeptidyl aminopeptidase/acylaminoacyl peptidase
VDLAERRISFMWGSGIYVANADGTERRLVARVRGAYGGQHWSGAARAFVTRVERPAGDSVEGAVIRADLDGAVTNLSARSRGTTDSMVSWSPDGKRIVFVSTRQGDVVPQLYVMNADGTGVRRIARTPFEAQYPQWGPDGSRIAFTGVVDGNFELFTITPDGDRLTRLTTSTEWENWPTWSPDSARIAFSVEPEIWTMSADGSDRTLVTVPQDVTGGEPNWSPDGALIAFDCGASPAICAIRPDGTGFTELFSRASFPFWIS